MHFESFTVPTRLLGLVLLLGLCLGTGEAVAQMTAPQAHTAAVYRHAEPGQPTMQVRVWGAVRAPGVYLVPRETDIIGLLSLAGGPVQLTETPNVRRTYHVHLARGGADARDRILEIPLSEVTRTTQPLPGLQDGDVLSVEVETTQRFGWRDGLQIFSSLGTVAVIVLNIIRLTN